MRAPPNTKKRAVTCAYCGPGITHIHIIDSSSYPNDIIAKKDKLGWKCGNCIEREIQDRIVRVTPNSQRARELIQEDKLKVDKHNQAVDKLNRNAGTQLMKRRSYKYK